MSEAMFEAGEAAWSPGIDVFERDNRLVTRVDLPGMTKARKVQIEEPDTAAESAA